jgi:hypothetical protein
MLTITMNELLNLLLEHPERFTACEVPCCLLGIRDMALDDLPDPVSVPLSVSRTNSSPASSRMEFA